MNPLRNNNFISGGLNPQLLQNIKQAKGFMSMAKGNPNAFMQQMSQNNPMFNQVMQMCNGQDPEQVFRAACKARGIDAEQFIRELQS